MWLSVTTTLVAQVMAINRNVRIEDLMIQTGLLKKRKISFVLAFSTFFLDYIFLAAADLTPLSP